MKNVGIVLAITALIIVGITFVSTSNNTVPNRTIIATPTKTVSKEYTLGQISNHNNEKDCYMAISGKVYDVTKFIPSHPGGNEILKGCGKDATEFFNNREDRGEGHSPRAETMLQQFEIGTLKA